MDEDLQLGVTTLFRDATKENLMSAIKTPQDWKRFNDIEAKAEDREQAEMAAFERDRPQLLANAKAQIIAKAGSKTHEHPTPFGIDRFNKSNIDAEAAQQIERAHQGRLLKIREDEAQGYSELKKDIRAREGVRYMARDAFVRSTDRRRAGPSR